MDQPERLQLVVTRPDEVGRIIAAAALSGIDPLIWMRDVMERAAAVAIERDAAGEPSASVVASLARRYVDEEASRGRFVNIVDAVMRVRKGLGLHNRGTPT